MSQVFISYRQTDDAQLKRVASLAIDRNDWVGAEALACETLSLSEKVGRLEIIANACFILAKSLVRLPHAPRAVEIFTRLNSPYLADAVTSSPSVRAR